MNFWDSLIEFLRGLFGVKPKPDPTKPDPIKPQPPVTSDTKNMDKASNYAIIQSDFNLMITAVNNFKGTPDLVYIRSNGVKKSTFVTWSKYQEMKGQWDALIKANRQAPPYMCINKPCDAPNTTVPQSAFPIYMYVNPNVETPNFTQLKGYGVTDVFYRLAHVPPDTSLINSIKKAGLKPAVWFFPNELNTAQIQQLANQGWNIHLDLEWNDYDPTNNLNLVKSIRSACQGKIFSAAVKADGWDGTAYYGYTYEALAPYVDYLMPMLYTGDYNKSNDQLANAVAGYEKRLPGKIVPILETYHFDNDPTPKSESVLLSEINAVLPIMKNVALFRDGLSNFRGIKATPALSAGLDCNNISTGQIQTTMQNLKSIDGMGYYTACMVDGVQGPVMTREVKRFQLGHNLTVDGEVGSKETCPELLQPHKQTVDTIGAEETIFADCQENTNPGCSDWKYMILNGCGDCWADVEFLYNKLSTIGVHVRVMGYKDAPANNAWWRHTWIQYNDGSGWKDWPYTNYGSQHHGDGGGFTPFVVIEPGKGKIDVNTLINTGY